MDWLYLINTLWGPISIVVGLLAAGFTLWLFSKVPTKAQVEAIEQRQAEHKLEINDHSSRLSHIEQLIDTAPTRQELQDDIAGLAARISAVEEGNHGIIRQLETISQYLHTVIEKLMPGAPPR